MKAYKGFDKNLSCLNFQYEIGRTYVAKGELKLCQNGFHACLDPLDCFRYYPPATSRYCIVELGDDNILASNEDNKVCGRMITIVKEITLDELYADAVRRIKHEDRWNASDMSDCRQYAHVCHGKSVAGNYSISECTNNGMAVSGQCSMSKTGNDGSAIAHRSSVAVSGNNGAAFVVSGVAKAGNYGMAVGKEVFSRAETGDDGRSIAGDEALSGHGGVSLADLKASVGDNGIAVVLSHMGMAKGGMDAMLVFKMAGKSIVVNGVDWLADTWYKLDDNNEIIKA